MTSDEGLNAYGAATWGQFFIYQGFNERTGWMHTSSGVDNVDEFAQKVEKRGDGFCYRYGKDCRRLARSQVTIRYRASNGSLASAKLHDLALASRPDRPRRRTAAGSPLR